MSSLRIPEILAYLLARLGLATEVAKEHILLGKLVNLVDPTALEYFIAEGFSVEVARKEAEEVESVSHKLALDEVEKYAELVSAYRKGQQAPLLEYFEASIQANEIMINIVEHDGKSPSRHSQIENKLFHLFVRQLRNI